MPEKSSYANDKHYNWKSKLVWERGRLVDKASIKPGYEKMLLAFSTKFFPFDMYLLRYKEGTEIRLHNDPIEGYKHYRINFLLWKAKRGGRFFCGEKNKDAILFWSKRLVIFRSDLALHRVTQVEEGTRLVLTIGIFRPIK